MIVRWHYSWALLSLIALVAMTGCGAGEKAAPVGGAQVSRVEGKVFYRERMMLPPGAQLEVQLQDISRADALASVLASVMVAAKGSPPYDFAIEYDPSTIDSRMRYALRATISVDDRLIFTSTEYIDPFGGAPIEVLVQRVPEPVRRSAPELENVLWTLRTLQGENAVLGSGGRPLELQLSADEEMRAAGFSGCNRYTGTYSREGTSQHGSPLVFGTLASTRMACADSAELEQSYLQMLSRVDAFRLEGDSLILLSGAETLAVFQPG